MRELDGRLQVRGREHGLVLGITTGLLRLELHHIQPWREKVPRGRFKGDGLSTADDARCTTEMDVRQVVRRSRTLCEREAGQQHSRKDSMRWAKFDRLLVS